MFVRDRFHGTTTRASLSWRGEDSNRASTGPYISANGRFVAFGSAASNLVMRDTNRVLDAFVFDRRTGRTVRVSVSSRGEQGNALSHPSSISANGRFVAFVSDATNLVPRDTNRRSDAFVHDLRTRTTERVSVDSNEQQANGASFRPYLSANARFVVFRSWARSLVQPDRNPHADVFVRDRLRGTTTRVSVSTGGVQGIGSADRPWINGSGRFVVFRSLAADLVPGDRNGIGDIFVHDRRTRVTIRVNRGRLGQFANGESFRQVISADGRVVAFSSLATNLVPGDTNRAKDIFVHVLARPRG